MELIQRPTRLQRHRGHGIVALIIPLERWPGSYGWIGEKDRCDSRYRWAFFKDATLIRFVWFDYVVNIWKPWFINTFPISGTSN